MCHAEAAEVSAFVKGPTSNSWKTEEGTFVSSPVGTKILICIHNTYCQPRSYLYNLSYKQQIDKEDRNVSYVNWFLHVVDVYRLLSLFFFFSIAREKYYKHAKKAEENQKSYLSLIIDNMDQSKTSLPRFHTYHKVSTIFFKKKKSKATQYKIGLSWKSIISVCNLIVKIRTMFS